MHASQSEPTDDASNKQLMFPQLPYQVLQPVTPLLHNTPSHLKPSSARRLPTAYCNVDCRACNSVCHLSRNKSRTVHAPRTRDLASRSIKRSLVTISRASEDASQSYVVENESSNGVPITLEAEFTAAEESTNTTNDNLEAKFELLKKVACLNRGALATANDRYEVCNV